MRSERHRATRWVLAPSAQEARLGGFAPLDDEKLQHLRKVLRMEWDEPARALDGAGRAFEARLEKRGSSGGLRLESLLREELQPVALELDICMAKNATMDWIIEKAVECGAARIVPIVSSRSVVKPHSGEADKYVRRWQAIADAAVEQSERLWRPLVALPVAWQDWLRPNNELQSFAFVSETRADLQGAPEAEEAALSRGWRDMGASRGRPVRALIGPEGGLSEQERADLRQAGFVELSLGGSVLRVETAVVAALTLLRVSRIIPAS